MSVDIEVEEVECLELPCAHQIFDAVRFGTYTPRSTIVPSRFIENGTGLVVAVRFTLARVTYDVLNDADGRIITEIDSDCLLPQEE